MSTRINRSVGAIQSRRYKLERATLPRDGIHEYVQRMPGFYVVNPTTNIAVERFQFREPAEAHARQVDARYPDDNVELVVLELLAAAGK